ncbi:hypothetical protein B0E45_31780 [Sinorhizobium sp. A49]|uniref:DUF4238 domain-containing protein n=1 Tax=Sinorhizobium sp. A49 TaxID=1945861 RepID=UPI00098672E8|nr:DUF4238 domain-containing protein [Sinorhizobium sp. A49]OOG61989.1 hypothetical protein B0E45_31780 [Sinorhizobium sp. A49]
MSKPKRHHFVPQLLQKRFVNNDGKLWAFDRRRASGAPYATYPNDALLEGQLYTVKEADGSQNAELESWFSRLESEAAPIVDKMVASVRANRLPRLNLSERITWDRFFLQQWRRVPDLFESLLPSEQFAKDVMELLDEFDTVVRPVSADERQRLLQKSELKRMRGNVFATTLLEESEEALDLLGSRGLAFLRVKNPRKSMILASRPVVRWGFKDNPHLSDPRTEMWLPISADVAVGVGRYDVPEFFRELTDSDTRFLNEGLARQSSQIVGRSFELINSLGRFVGDDQVSNRY